MSFVVFGAIVYFGFIGVGFFTAPFLNVPPELTLKEKAEYLRKEPAFILLNRLQNLCVFITMIAILVNFFNS